MREFKNFLVGLNEENEIVMVDRVTLKDDNTFTIVFSTWNIDVFNNDVCEQHAEMLIDGSEKDWLYDRCEYFDCKPSDLAEQLASNFQVGDVFDYNSTYSEECQDENGDDVYLTFSGSTPQDYQWSDIVKYVNSDIEKLFHKANEIGKEYHLKEIPTDIGDKIMDLFDWYEDKNTFDEDIQFIKDNMN